MTTVYYRRTDRPYAFPAMHPVDVEVSTKMRKTGPADSDWQTAAIDDGIVDFPESHTEPTLVADQIVIDLAIRRAMGLPEYEADDWTPFDPSDLDDSDSKSYENLCDAVMVAFGEDAARIQRIKLRSRLNPDYLRSHSIDPETGEYR